MLDTLAYLLAHAADETEKDLFVELTLTVPVRLTNLLPHLSYLMKPLVHALSAGPDDTIQKFVQPESPNPIMAYDLRRYNTLSKLGIEQLPPMDCTEVDNTHQAFVSNLPVRTMPVGHLAVVLTTKHHMLRMVHI